MTRHFFFALFMIACAIVSSSLSVFAGEELDEHEGSPFERMKYFYERRSYPFERIPDNAYIEAYNYAKRSMNAKKSAAQILAQQPEWRQIGPIAVGGRVRSIVMHPAKPDATFIGAAAGGVWKTENNGQSWTPIMDFENTSAMGALAIDRNNPDVMLAATGEMVSGSWSMPGAGIYKTTDGGKNWRSVGLTTVGAFSKIYIHPKNSQIVYAGGAMSGGGFYKSTDGGESWKRTLEGTVSDISINADDENELFIGVTGESVYKSTDGGESWIRLNLSDNALGRISTQQSKSDKNIVYALAGGDGNAGYVFKSINRGQTWTVIWNSDNIFTSGGNSQAGYDNFIAVHPTNPNIVLVGGVNLYRTTDGGKTLGGWYQVGGYNTDVHPDMHCAAFGEDNPNIVYLGCDGGMYRSEDAGDTWSNINNGLAITQFHDIGLDNKSNKVYGGAQDNGTMSSTATTWGEIVGGDGGFTAVDPTNSGIIYGETQNGALWKMTNGSIKSLSNLFPSDDPGAWVTPIVIDPIDPKTVYCGRSALYISGNRGDRWDVASPRYGGKISAIGVSPVDPAIIYIGTARGEIAVTTEGGGTWTNIAGLPARFVSDIAPSYNDANTAYISLSGFRTAHVYKTTNLGKTWTDIGKGLPDVPVNALAIHPDDEKKIFIGTDIGVFATYDGGASWFPFGVGFPSTMAIELEFYMPPIPTPGKVTLRCGTHGRSIWEIDVPSDIITEQEITAPIGGEIFVSGEIKDASWYGFTPPVKVEYTLNDGKTWTNIAEGATGNSLKWIIPDKATYLARIRVSSITEPVQVRTTRTFTIIQKYTGLVLQSSGVRHIPYGLAYDGKNGLWATAFDSDTSIAGRLYKYNATTLVFEKAVKITQGDSLFTDLTLDRATGEFYVHKIATTSAAIGGSIYVMDSNGTVKRSFKSPCIAYPIGLELVNGVLYCADRDGGRWIYKVDPSTGNEIGTRAKNPFDVGSGPRSICSAPDGILYQASTNFGGGSLSNSYAVKFTTANLSKEISKFELQFNASPINVRGIEYDPRDKNFWVSDYGGTIYKVAGMEIQTGVNEPADIQLVSDIIIAPNPANELCYIGFTPSRAASIVTVTVNNMLGAIVAKVYEGTVMTDEQKIVRFDSSALPNGVYAVVLTFDNARSITEKLIINR